MKRMGLWAIGIGMLCIVGILTVKQGYPVPNKCSVATLKGTYLFDGISYVVDTSVPPQVLVYIAVAGRSIYTGDGNSTTLARLTVNGVHEPDSAATGIYTVDADCKGTETLTDLATGDIHTYVTIISADGNEIHFVGTDPGAVRALVSRRVER